MKKSGSRNRYGNTSIPPTSKKKTILFQAFKEPITRLIEDPQLQIVGNYELYLEGCTAILSYSDGLVQLAAGKQKLLLTGKELSVSGYTESSITVRGIFDTLEWEGGECNESHQLHHKTE